MEHKKIKQDIHARLLGECVGSGKLFFSKPPTDYNVPDNVKSGNKCKKQIKVLLKSLGKGPATKSDELLEKIQTAFGPPPPHFWKIMLQFFEWIWFAFMKVGIRAR